MNPPCNMIFDMPPLQIRWIIMNQRLQPHILMQTFAIKYPQSNIIQHGFCDCCVSCKASLLMMFKKNGLYGEDEV